MSADRVVVCTPTFHRAELLKRAIESVLGQTYRDFEHVVVQDGCDRGGECAACRETAAVGERFQKHDPRFRFVVLPEHMGGYGFYSRNWAIEHSDAPLIAYLDDDNWWEPTHLETLVNALRVSRASFAFSGTIMRDQRGRTIHRRISRRPYYMGIDTNEIVHRRELIGKYGAWKPTDAAVHNHDWELVARWLRSGETFAPSGEATTNYPLNPGRSALGYWYSFAKRRLFYELSRVFQNADHRYRARDVTSK